MKKLFVASALALALTVAGQQRASAWSECKFSVGINFGWVGGGNRCLCGLYRSAPYPGGPDLAPAFVVAPYNPGYCGGVAEFVPPMPSYGGLAPLQPVNPVAPLPPAAAAYGGTGSGLLSGFGPGFQNPTTWYGP